MELCGTVAVRATAACENRGFLKPVTFEVILAVVLNGTVFRDGTQCGVALKCQSFAETCCIIFRVEDLFFFTLDGKMEEEFSYPKTGDNRFYRNVVTIYRSTQRRIRQMLKLLRLKSGLSFCLCYTEHKT
jgi:hypothetical protein